MSHAILNRIFLVSSQAQGLEIQTAQPPGRVALRPGNGPYDVLRELDAARTALIAERSAFRMLFELAPDGYLVTDHVGAIERANRMAGTLLGVPRENLLRKPLTVFVPVSERIAFRALLARMASGTGGTMLTFEANLIARGGRSFGASIRVAGGGRDLRWSIRDVTAERRSQQDLRDAHRRLEGHAEALRVENEERSRTEERLRLSEERYRQLSSHLRASIESERARIAREVHDELGAALTAIRFELSSMRGGTCKDEGVQQSIAASIERTDAAIRATRRLCSDLRPSLLDHMGLWPAIEWLVEDLAGRAGIQAIARLDEGREVREPERATAIFRIVQEAVTNVVRHAGASNLRVVANGSNTEMAIEVSDDGRGIADTEIIRPDAFGIIGMQERARACGGDVSIVRQSKGTRVTVRVPIAAEARCES